MERGHLGMIFVTQKIRKSGKFNEIRGLKTFNPKDNRYCFRFGCVRACACIHLSRMVYRCWIKYLLTLKLLSVNEACQRHFYWTGDELLAVKHFTITIQISKQGIFFYPLPFLPPELLGWFWLQKKNKHPRGTGSAAGGPGSCHDLRSG